MDTISDLSCKECSSSDSCTRSVTLLFLTSLAFFVPNIPCESRRSQIPLNSSCPRGEICLDAHTREYDPYNLDSIISFTLEFFKHKSSVQMITFCCSGKTIWTLLLGASRVLYTSEHTLATWLIVTFVNLSASTCSDIAGFFESPSAISTALRRISSAFLASPVIAETFLAQNWTADWSTTSLSVSVILPSGCILIFHPGFQGFQGRVLGFLGLFQGFSTRILANFRVLPQPIISAFLDRIPHFHVSRPPNPLSSSFLDHLA